MRGIILIAIALSLLAGGLGIVPGAGLRASQGDHGITPPAADGTPQATALDLDRPPTDSWALRTTNLPWGYPGPGFRTGPVDRLYSSHPQILSGVPWLSASSGAGLPLFPSLPSAAPGVAGPAVAWATNVPVGFEGGQVPQNEPAVAVSPVDPTLVVAIYHDYGTRALVTIKVSHDGGQTWSGRIPQPGRNGTTFDPAITVNATGAFFASYLANDFFAATSHLIVATSKDGGRTWNQTVARRGAGPGEFLDKDYIAADPATGTLYATYTNFGATTMNIEVVRSTDGGVTWSTPKILASADFYDQPGGHVLQGAVPAARKGVAMVTYYDSGNDGWLTGNFSVMAVNSTDGGASWGQPVKAATLPGEMPYNLPSGIPDKFFWPRIWGTMFPVPAIGTEGNFYALSVAANGNLGDVFFLKSTNKGATWASKVIGNDPAGRAQFFPWVSVGTDGTVHVTYGDRRDDPEDTFYDISYTASTDGGLTFRAPVTITDTANTPSWYFIGDYFGLAASSTGVQAVWTDNRVFGGVNDIYAVRGDLITAGPALRTVPNRAEVGENVTVSGTGFSPSGIVAVSLNGTLLKNATTNPSGAFSTLITIPSRTAGRYQLVAKDSSGRQALRFYIVKPSILAPGSAPIGAKVMIQGSHFKPNHELEVFVALNPLTRLVTSPTGTWTTDLQLRGPPGIQRVWAATFEGPFLTDDFDLQPIQVLPPPGWTLLKPLPEPREGAAGEVSVGKVYLLHGYAPKSGDTRDVRIYDPATDVWSQGTAGLNPNSSEHYQGARVMRAGLERLYMIGGRSGTVLADNREYTPATGTWEERAAMPTHRAGMAVAVVDNKIYVIGGRDCPAPFCGNPLKVVEVYDPETDTWSTGTPMPTPRSGAAAAALGGVIVISGGWTAGNFTSARIVGTTEVYDPLTNSWSSAPDMGNPRAYLGSATCAGWVVAAGGAELSSFGGLRFSDAVEIFHPALGWRFATWVPTPRAQLVVVAGGNTLYALGGGLFGQSVDASERFDCTTLPPAPALLRLSANPSHGPVGTSVTIQGSGARGAGIILEIFLDGVSPANRLGVGTTDASGHVQITVAIPPAVHGGHRIIVRDTPVSYYGSSSFSVEASMAATPSAVLAGQKLTLMGLGYPAFAPVELTFEDTHLATVTTDGIGSFSATVFAPDVLGGAYSIHARTSVEKASAIALISLIHNAVLDMQVEPTPVRVRGEVATVDALVTLGGTPRDATVTAVLHTLEGSQNLMAQRLAPGLYRFSFKVAAGAAVGAYSLVVAATFEGNFVRANGTALSSFRVVPTLAGTNGALPILVSIDGDMGTVLTDRGAVVIDLAAVNARVDRIDGDRAIIKTDVGTLVANVRLLQPRVVGYDGINPTVDTRFGRVTITPTQYAFFNPSNPLLLAIAAASAAVAGVFVFLSRRRRAP